MKKLLLCISFASCGIFGAAQNAAPAQPSPAAQSVRPGDVDSIDHIITAVYDVISGPAGPRDWNRFQSLFFSGARLIPSRREPGGKVSATALTPDQYAERARDRFNKDSFFENSVANRVESWDNIAHVWSTYESHHVKGDAPFARGINSFQLFNDGSRWWIVTIYWEAEDPAHSLPEKYLK